MADLNEIVAAMDEKLRTVEIKDYPGAMNGLQLQNSGKVERIFSAVDASLAVVEEAAKEGGLLIVHHGMFWQGAQALTGTFYQKIKAAMDGGLAIYSTHLPLDVHPEIGNNQLLAQKIGLRDIKPILQKNGFPMGVSGEWSKSRDELKSSIDRATGKESTLCPAGSERPTHIAVMTGGAGSQIADIVHIGMDSFVTGEGSHWTFIEAEEKKINVFYGGHYATEILGIQALGEFVSEKYNLEHRFIIRPGGL